MTETKTETVKLVNVDGIADILDRLSGLPESTQTAVDLLFVALILFEAEGAEQDSVYGLVSKQYPRVRTFVDKLPLRDNEDDL